MEDRNSAEAELLGLQARLRGLCDLWAKRVARDVAKPYEYGRSAQIDVYETCIDELSEAYRFTAPAPQEEQP